MNHFEQMAYDMTLIEKKMLNCVICGKTIEKSQYSNAVLCSSACFQKHFWKEIIAEKDKYIVVNGVCYCDGGDKPNPSRHAFLGFAGRRFWIRFFDGKTITTNNLWLNGEIPEEFRTELPDTAEFYTPEHITFANSLIGGEHY